MIGKQTKGKSFRGVLNYLHDHEASRIIGGNMAGATPRVLSAEFAVARQLNPQLSKAVYHSSLSLPKEEHLDDLTWNQIADDYIEGMEFTGSQYVVYRHSDKDHDHIHIVASRIRITDGTTVSDSWDYPRSEQLIRNLETKYQLTPTLSSNQKLSRGISSGEMRLIERTGEASEKDSLRAAIDRETEQPLSMPELIHRLKDRGIDARIAITRTDKVKGISYQLDTVATSGTHLGRAYTFNGLQKYKQVRYDDNNQREELIKASDRQPSKQANETAAETEVTQQLELSLEPQQQSQKEQLPQPDSPAQQKQMLARALVEQKSQQRQINQRLRTLPGRLAVLTDKNTISVLAIKFRTEGTQQEKLIIKHDETGLKVVKDELNSQQTAQLLTVLKGVEQQSWLGLDNNSQSIVPQQGRRSRRGRGGR